MEVQEMKVWKTKTATILAISKGILGLPWLIGVAVTVMKLFDGMQAAVQGMKASSETILEAMQKLMIGLIPLQGLPSEWRKVFTQSFLIGTWGSILMVVLFIFFFLLLFIEPVLEILDSFGAVSLRFLDKGEGLIERVHRFRARIRLILGLEMILYLVGIFMNQDAYVALIGEAGYKILVISMVLWVWFLLIGLFITYAYHKNVADAMAGIGMLKNNSVGKYRKNHLSGMCLFLGVIWLLLTVAIAIEGDRIPAENVYGIPVFACTLLMAIKYLAMWMANNQLKKEMSQWNR